MSGTAERAWGLAVVGVAILAAWWILRLARRRGGEWVRGRLLAGMPRPQHACFVLRLRDLLFEDPFGRLEMLWGEDGAVRLRLLWREVGRKTGGVGGTLPPPGGVAEDDFEVYRMQTGDGRALAVVRMPECQHAGEAYLVGVVLPRDERLKTELPRAREALRVFVLKRWGGPDGTRDTDLCAWIMEGGRVREFTYNVGAPRDPAGFARAVEAKMRETRR